MGDTYRPGLPEICVLYLCIWTISPPLQQATLYRLIALGCAFLWFLLTREEEFLDHDEQMILLFVLLVVLVSIIEYEGFSKILSNISIYMFFVGFMMVNYYKNRPDAIKFIVPIVLLLLIVWNTRTSTAIATDSHVARYIVRNSEEANAYLSQGVGGYGLIYSQVCVFPALLSWTLSSIRHSKLKFAIGILWCASYIMLVMESGYATAFAASVIGVIVLFFYKQESVTNTIVVAILICYITMLLIVNVDSFRNFLLNIFDGTTVTKKINDLLLSAKDKTAQGSISVRLEAYKNSFLGILGYPITGGLWWNSGGGHSAIMDMFAKYGLFGGIMFYRTLLCVPTHFRLFKYNKHFLRMVNATFFTIFFVSFLDSTPYQFAMMLTIVAFAALSQCAEWTTNG